jgi:DNA-binding FadR family transcriptional regulator
VQDDPFLYRPGKFGRDELMARKHRDVMRALLADIVSGVRPTGAMLPKETDLAAEFDVSRGVARETIRAMEERGLISMKHGRGATINRPEHARIRPCGPHPDRRVPASLHRQRRA